MDGIEQEGESHWLDGPLGKTSTDPLERWHARVFVALALFLVIGLGALTVIEFFLRGPLDTRTLVIAGATVLCSSSLGVTAATGRWWVSACGVLSVVWVMVVGLDRLDSTNDPVAAMGLAMWLVAAVSTLGHRAALPAFSLAALGLAIGGGLLEAPPDNIALVTYLATAMGLLVLAGMIWGADHSREQAMRRALQRAQDAQALAESQRQFIATMSHEIRTPMNGVLNLSRLLEQTALDRDQAMLVRTLLGSGRSLMSILNDVLDFSRLEAGADSLEQIPLDLREMLTEICQLLGGTAADAGLALRSHVDDSVPSHVTGDPTRVRQIVTNLVSNAIKFTPSGHVTVTAAATAGGVAIEVADTGVGIPEGALAHIFEPFTQADASTTRQFGGTGLGLAICKRLCAAMGGDISVRSEPGVGTTFTVALPLPAVAPLPTAAPPVMPHQPPRRLGARVLVAEDHPVNQLVVRRLLEQAGVEAAIVDDGYAAVSQLAAGERFDLVLMDLYMPNLDGFAATRAIRSLPGAASRTPIVALSASALPEDRQRSREAGMDGHLPKPIDPPALHAVLDRWLPPATAGARIAAGVPSG